MLKTGKREIGRYGEIWEPRKVRKKGERKVGRKEGRKEA